MNTTIRKIGNSEGVILPKELLNRLNLQTGDTLEVIDNGAGIELKPVDDTFERQMAAAHAIMDRYKIALQKLAE